MAITPRSIPIYGPTLGFFFWINPPFSICLCFMGAALRSLSNWLLQVSRCVQSGLSAGDKDVQSEPNSLHELISTDLVRARQLLGEKRRLW